MKVFISLFLMINLVWYLAASFYACSFDITKLGDTPKFCVAVTFAMINIVLLVSATSIYLAKKS